MTNAPLLCSCGSSVFPWHRANCPVADGAPPPAPRAAVQPCEVAAASVKHSDALTPALHASLMLLANRLSHWHDVEPQLVDALWRAVEMLDPNTRRAQPKAVEQDAARYRWLRSQTGEAGAAIVDIVRPGGDWSNSESPRTPEALDVAIDNARSVEPMNAAHTAGPWYVGDFRDDEGCVDVIANVGPSRYGATRIARIYWTREHTAHAEMGHANARLIAAAPQLAEALRKIIGNADSKNWDLDEIADNARAALMAAGIAP